MRQARLCKTLIGAAQMSEHLRVSLIDPRYQQQRNAMLSKIRETTKASDDEIARNLVGLAKSRPDVFGAHMADMAEHQLWQRPPAALRTLWPVQCCLACLRACMGTSRKCIAGKCLSCAAAWATCACLVAVPR